MKFAKLYRQCKAAGACPEGLRWLARIDRFNAFQKQPGYAMWLLRSPVALSKRRIRALAKAARYDIIPGCPCTACSCVRSAG